MPHNNYEISALDKGSGPTVLGLHCNVTVALMCTSDLSWGARVSYSDSLLQPLGFTVCCLESDLT